MLLCRRSIIVELSRESWRGKYFCKPEALIVSLAFCKPFDDLAREIKSFLVNRKRYSWEFTVFRQARVVNFWFRSLLGNSTARGWVRNEDFGAVGLRVSIQSQPLQAINKNNLQKVKNLWLPRKLFQPEEFLLLLFTTFVTLPRTVEAGTMSCAMPF